MKKAYSKPQIYFESFSLSQNIAAGCEVPVGDPRLEFTGLGFAFTDEDNNCGYKVPGQVGGDGEYNGICYHVFTNEGKVNLHNS